MGINSVNFSVGNYQVDRSKVNPAMIRNMTNGAGNIKVEKNISQDEWDALADRVELSDAVSKEDFTI